jgi:hypothetical protein
VTEASVATLPTRTTTRHHWGDKYTVPSGPSGCEETHRVCTQCQIIKITVHPPDRRSHPYRLWQYPDGERADGLTPLCAPHGEVPFQ